MNRFERFYPDYAYKSVWDIEDGFFKENGIEFAILDIDNTLVPYTEKTPSKRALEFLQKLEESGVKYCFLSNNKGKRVIIFNENIGAPFLARAKKPLCGGINKIMKMIGAKPQNTVLIGDQVFTDVWTGKRAGIKTILVSPIEDKETLFFRFKRAMERIVLKNYNGR